MTYLVSWKSTDNGRRADDHDTQGFCKPCDEAEMDRLLESLAGDPMAYAVKVDGVEVAS